MKIICSNCKEKTSKNLLNILFFDYKCSQCGVDVTKKYDGILRFTRIVIYIVMFYCSKDVFNTIPYDNEAIKFVLFSLVYFLFYSGSLTLVIYIIFFINRIVAKN